MSCRGSAGAKRWVVLITLIPCPLVVLCESISSSLNLLLRRVTSLLFFIQPCLAPLFSCITEYTAGWCSRLLKYGSFISRTNMKFVQRVLPDPCEESFPNTRFSHPRESVFSFFPIIEGSDDRDLFSVGCPDGEIGAGCAIGLGRMCTQLVVEVKVSPFVKE